MRLIRKILLWLVSIAAILICALLLRFWVFDLFLVPSDSMYPILKPGDKVLVFKLTIGARIYNDWSSVRKVKPDVRRTKGFRHIRRNDVLVFNCPATNGFDKTIFDFNNIFTKRCIALPGDTLYIKNGFFSIPGTTEQLGYLLSQQQLSQMPENTRFQESSYAIMSPDSIENPWTVKNFGPLWIPGRYTTAELTPQNLPLYASIIEYETGHRPFINDGQVIHNDKPINKYTFLTDYYFVCGDNTTSSLDSRHWRFVPEEFVIGVVSRILYNKNEKFSRIFKKVK